MARLFVPEDVLQAVVDTPEMWPAILEMAQWHRDAQTGAIEIDVADGEGRELRRVQRIKLGKALGVPSDLIGVCPTEGCGADLVPHDYGNRYYCNACDMLYTVWDLKRRNSFRSIMITRRVSGDG